MHLRDLLVSKNYRHPMSWGFEVEKSLDLGCGLQPRNPFGAQTLLGVDVIAEEELRTDSSNFAIKGMNAHFTYKRVERCTPLPFDNSTFDAVTAYDFIEHLSREPVARLGTNEFIFLLNEVSRVLKSGGVFLAVTPAFPSPASFQDPTHTNFISEKTSDYFVGVHPAARIMQYGFAGSFRLIHQFWLMPFNKIMETTSQSEDSDSSFCMSKLRSYVANMRKPTHLVWLFENH